MDLKQTRADFQQYQDSGFRLRKPKRMKNLASSTSSLTVLGDLNDVSFSFTNSKINTILPMNYSLDIQTQPQYIQDDDDFSITDDESSINDLPMNYSLDVQTQDDDYSSINDDQPSINDGSGFYDDISNNSEDINEEPITKEYDGNKKQNHYPGNAGPYFPSLTIFLIFLWVTKHQIDSEVYKDFANIVKHPEFNSNDVPFSLATIKNYRNGLPLLPFKGHIVTINNRYTPSTSKPTRHALIFPLKDILHRVLTNPLLRKNMYFGPVRTNVNYVMEIYDTNPRYLVVDVSK
jgi:hypothetical protein